MFEVAAFTILAALFTDQQQRQSEAFGDAGGSELASKIGAAARTVRDWALKTFPVRDVSVSTVNESGVVGTAVTVRGTDDVRPFQAAAEAASAQHGVTSSVRASQGAYVSVVFSNDPKRAWEMMNFREAYGVGLSSPMAVGGATFGDLGYGADPLSQLKELDNQIFSTTKSLVGTMMGLKLAAKRNELKSLGVQRDTLIASGAPSNSPQVASVDAAFRNVVASVIGQSLTDRIENAIRQLKDRRDAIVRQIGQLGLVKNWESYGGMSTGESDIFGQLRRADLFGANSDRWSKAWSRPRYGANSRIEEIEAVVIGIVKRVLGWRVATKGPKLISLNNQRDKLIEGGVPLSDPRVSGLEEQAIQLLKDAGMAVPGSDYAKIKQLSAERDRLLQQQVGVA